jgi:2-polyprenyl-3-methyl-5-hydroxy-6-metoxy-1,4-benzoquinol methylase
MNVDPDSIHQVERESELARQLLESDSSDRQSLYATAYDEIYTLHMKRFGPDPSQQTLGAQPTLLSHLLRLTSGGDRVLEIGCGTGFLSLQLARAGRRVVGVDVSEVAINLAKAHADNATWNAPTFNTMAGDQIPYEDESFDAAFSVEVIEHLHEQDVEPHLREVLRVLRPGGCYWFITPNALTNETVVHRWGLDSADHESLIDIHLKVWTVSELLPVIRSAGFTRPMSPLYIRRLSSLPYVPSACKALAERCVTSLPMGRFRSAVLRYLGLRDCVVSAHKLG